MTSPALPGFRELGALDEWRDFVRSEFDCQRRAERERAAQPLALRVENGTCLPNLRLLSIDGNRAIFSHPGNDSRLRQLGPVVLSRPRREAGDAGIFHTLRARSGGGTRLDVTYRLNDALARWPAENFYGGELEPAPSVASHRLAWVPPRDLDASLAEALAPHHPLVHVPSRSAKARTRNCEEASIAAELVRALRRGGVAPEDAAVVTPYRSQARQIRRALETLDSKANWGELLIDTVERMQGQEREVVLLSLCASDPRFLRRQAEFLLDPRRLNVAATRARAKLIVLASTALLDLDLDDTDLREDLELLRSLCADAREVAIPAAEDGPGDADD